MCERKKYIATLPFREKLTYDNVKKFVPGEQNINRKESSDIDIVVISDVPTHTHENNITHT
jgi:hypothetical protein